MTSEQQIFNTAAPPQHADIHIIDANETYLFGSRGSLKTWLAGSLYILRRTFEMPRGSGVIVGLTFAHLMDNTLPPLQSFLTSRGFVDGEDYCLMKPPPAHWPKPYAGVVDPKYKNAWTWSNGFTWQLISLRRKASANAVSAQCAYMDEAKFLDQKQLEDEIFPIIRPIEISDPLFKNCSGYLSKFFSTDKRADPAKIQWLLKKRDKVDHVKVELVRSIQYHVNDLKEKLVDANKTAQLKLQREIYEDEERLRKLRSTLVYVAEINADDVRPILGDKWYKSKLRDSKEYDWKIIYLNQDPDRPGEAFYPAFDINKHVYTSDKDIDNNAPLIISLDYQHTVVPIPVSQIGQLPGKKTISLNYVDEIYTLHPLGLRDAVKLFCKKYEKHGLKYVYYVYDHTAIGGRLDTDEYYKIVIDELENNGWQVIEIYTGRAPGHYDKYVNTIDWMVNEKNENIDIRINIKCKKLIISISGAAAKTVGKETKKDKDNEREDVLDQSETTHFSDAFDMTNEAVLKLKMISEIMESIPFSFR